MSHFAHRELEFAVWDSRYRIQYTLHSGYKRRQLCRRLKPETIGVRVNCIRYTYTEAKPPKPIRGSIEKNCLTDILSFCSLVLLLTERFWSDERNYVEKTEYSFHAKAILKVLLMLRTLTHVLDFETAQISTVGGTQVSVVSLGKIIYSYSVWVTHVPNYAMWTFAERTNLRGVTSYQNSH